jgi:hypothetical protein
MQGDPREIQLIRTEDSRKIWRKYRHIQRKKKKTRGKQEDIMRFVGDTERSKEIHRRYNRSGKVYEDPCKIQGYEEDKREIHRSRKDNVRSEEGSFRQV